MQTRSKKELCARASTAGTQQSVDHYHHRLFGLNHRHQRGSDGCLTASRAAVLPLTRWAFRHNTLHLAKAKKMFKNLVERKLLTGLDCFNVHWRIQVREERFIKTIGMGEIKVWVAGGHPRSLSRVLRLPLPPERSAPPDLQTGRSFSEGMEKCILPTIHCLIALTRCL